MTRSVFTKRYRRFREVMRHARKSRGITQVKLAKKLKQPQSYVSKYERGERRLDVVEFLTVAKALGVDAKELIDEILNG